MKIISCIKPVPDSASRLIINEAKTWIKDQDLTFVASEADNYALEEALRLKEKHSGDVVVLSMGGEEAARVLRSGLAMGADRAIHLLDPKFKGADEFAAAATLAKVIEKDGGADLVLTGVQSDDLGTGMTGTMLAEFLGWAHATVVVGVEANPDAKSLKVRRELEGGINESVELPMPAVLTVQFGINQPRYASLKGIMAAKRKEFKAVTAADLGLADDAVGKAGAMYEVREILIPARKSRVEMISGTPEEEAASLVEKLRKEAKVL
ncbi:MAG TPA: electron transfer flavoprotein subunit beta/FixA family protein [Terriglobia bacterium]|nr:electron transfer flavoprotein subunit beta/FixA family protein [Terriglobia bacterium]